MKGFKYENDPNRNRCSADGRERVGAAGGEHAGQCKSRGAVQHGERKGDHADRSKNSATAPRGACRGRTPIFAVGAGGCRAWKRFTSRHEKTIPIHLFSTRFTGRKQHRTSICSRTSLRKPWRH